MELASAGAGRDLTIEMHLGVNLCALCDGLPASRVVRCWKAALLPRAYDYCARYDVGTTRPCRHVWRGVTHT